MMDGYLEQPVARRRLLCEQAQEQLNLPASSVEKDYWVCWILRELFGIPGWGRNLTFKGGTSLSKCWNLINRFSEDIDIVIGKDFLGSGGQASPENAASKKQRKKRLLSLKKAAQNLIADSLLPTLDERIGLALSTKDNWNLALAPEAEDPDRQTILFEYPSVLTGAKAYVRSAVKIEMGARSDNEPAEQREVHPYLFDVFPDILGPGKFTVSALCRERTFWEKIMLVHEENHRPPGEKRRPVRLARHYYDLWCLITKGVAGRAVEREDIFARAARHREIYFNRSWMDYSTLRRGKLRLVPLPGQVKEWRKDYQAMSEEMFFGEVPKFEEVLRVVEDFEKKFR